MFSMKTFDDVERYMNEYRKNDKTKLQEYEEKRKKYMQNRIYSLSNNKTNSNNIKKYTKEEIDNYIKKVKLENIQRFQQIDDLKMNTGNIEYDLNNAKRIIDDYKSQIKDMEYEVERYKSECRFLLRSLYKIPAFIRNIFLGRDIQASLDRKKYN